MSLSQVFSPTTFNDIDGWASDRVSGAFTAFRRSAGHATGKAYRTGALGVAFDAFAEPYDAARSRSTVDENLARAFFERYFVPCRVTPESGTRGFVTGYYEPEIEASPHRTARFTVPLYARPDDLIDMDDANRPGTLDPGFEFGRYDGHTLAEYHDRRAIERGALAGRGLEIAWLADRVEAFFSHVQGAARLHMTDGSLRRVTYAAKSGHPFTGPGGILADLGEIAREAVTMQSIKAWFRDNPGRIDEILHRNRSYIFFREAPVDDPSLGPIAAAKVPLAPGRSIAVDRKLHTFATPFFVSAPALRDETDTPFRRLTIAQDTGSAIVGPARADIFFGSGNAAGERAGVVRHEAEFVALLPKALFGHRS